MTILFYKFPVTTQVFHLTKYTFALVNLKPLVPGHVLVVPLRVVGRLSDLPQDESIDFFQTVQLIQGFITKVYSADACNIAIQDGVAAGQSVPHVHCHIIPRYFNDQWGDDVYRDLELWEGGLIEGQRDQRMDLNSQVNKLIPDQPWYKQINRGMNIQNDEDRRPRSMQVMEEEAEMLKNQLENFINEQQQQQ